MNQADILTLFHAFRDHLDRSADDSPEHAMAFAMSGDFFSRLQLPGYRMSIPERENALAILTDYIQHHPLDSRAQQELHRRLSSCVL